MQRSIVECHQSIIVSLNQNNRRSNKAKSKMVSRYTLTFFVAVVLFVGIVSVAVGEEDEDRSLEARNPALLLATRILQRAFARSAGHCIHEAAQNCRSHWGHKRELIKCAGHFLKNNKGRCALG